jgi:hypothetical protein
MIWGKIDNDKSYESISGLIGVRLVVPLAYELQFIYAAIFYNTSEGLEIVSAINSYILAAFCKNLLLSKIRPP